MVHVMSEVKRCAHGVIAPHECNTCLDALVVPSHWLEPVGGCVIDNWSKMQGMRGSDQYSEPLYPQADFDVQRLRADTAEATVAERDEALALSNRDLIEAQTAVTGWARKHAAAEQRIAELVKTLTATREALGREYWDQYAGLDETREILDAALNPNPEAESHEHR